MTKRSLTLILPLCAALAIACGSESSLGPRPATPSPTTPPPATPGLLISRIDLAPDSTALVQGDSYVLTVAAWDQRGVRLLENMSDRWVDKATIVSSDSNIARVSGGLVTAVAPGIVRISASLTYAGGTVTDTVTTQVEPATAMSARLTMNQNKSWSSTTVSVKAGATVTWVIPDSVQPGTIWLNVWDDNAEKLEFINGVATHTFPSAGVYFYGTGGGLMWYEEGGKIQVY